MPPSLQPNKKKRLFVAVGIFCLPVIALSVAIVGLWHPHNAATTKATAGSAFNTTMPSPNLKETEKNKLQLYMEAEADSLKRSQDRQKDPYATPAAAVGTASLPATHPGVLSPLPTLPATPAHGVVSSPFADNTDQQVADRLQKIYAALGHPGSSAADHPAASTPSREAPPNTSVDLNRLERLMQSVQKADTAPSVELTQVKQVLEQITALTHVDHTPAAIAAEPPGTQPLVVAAQPMPEVDSNVRIRATVSQNAFYGLAEDSLSPPGGNGSIEAVIHGDQTVQAGSTVKLRLIQPIYVGGVQIPANSFIYGTAGISGERVTIELTNAIYNGKVYPIAMKVYDGSDGLAGLYVPGMITRDVLKQNMAQGVGGVGIGTLDPSLGAQAAEATIETAKNLLSRKIAVVKATLKAGHLAILKPSGEQR